MVVPRIRCNDGYALVFAGLTALAMLAPLTGCQGHMRDKKHPRLITQQDAAAYVKEALESPIPDRRRQAVYRLAQSRYATQPTTLDTLALVAKSDKSQSVRAAAVRGLGRASDPIVTETCLAVVAPGRDGADPAADENVRAAALENLIRLARADQLPANRQDEIGTTGIRLLREDRSRNVRLAAVRLLGYFATREALAALIEALQQRDFGVCHEAERSLMRLTGRTFDHDAAAWQSFVDKSANPFAERGKLDDELDPPMRSWSDGLGSWWKPSSKTAP